MKPITAAKLLKLEVDAHAQNNDDLLSVIEEVRAYRLSGAKIDPVAAKLASVSVPEVMYFLNPGDMQDVREVDPRHATSLKGDLYRYDGHELQRYDRITSRWYGYDSDELNSSVPIKVLRAAGLCA